MPDFVSNFRQHGIETVVVKRPEFSTELLNWADAVFTAGGDGTFLDAASKILTNDKPIIGVNTDPARYSTSDENKNCVRNLSILSGIL